MGRGSGVTRSRERGLTSEAPLPRKGLGRAESKVGEHTGRRTSVPTGRGGQDCSKNQVSYVHGSN